MELDVKESKKNKIVVEIKGEGHSLCNSLVKELWKVTGVVTAGYYVEHPQVGVPTLIVETKTGTSASEAIQKAAKALKKTNSKFLKALQKEVK